MKNEYDAQAEKFLTDNGIKCRITLSDSKPANWAPSGHHYRVTLSKGKPCTADYTGNIRSAARLTFDFWGSVADAAKGITTERPYSVLSAISGDIHTPETFKDFCAEFGESEDSIKALQTFKRCDRFARRLREFFTATEIEQLTEIR
jgi:hypothetical protein